MAISQYFISFIFYSFLGWVWESIYCTIKEKRWADRGFLFGPVCPIYGSCVVGAEILVKEFHLVSSQDTPVWVIFLIGMIASAIVEYGTSYVLEKHFHARWWDYSDVPLNLNGRICLPASICFGLAGVLVVKWMIPVLGGMGSNVHPLVYEGVALLFAALIGADLALTEASLSTLLQTVEEYKAEMNQRAENTYENLATMPKRVSGNLYAARVRLAESTKQRMITTKEAVALSKQRMEVEREKWSESREAMAERYVGRLNFFQRRSLGTIQRFVPRKGEHPHPEHKVMENLKAAMSKRPWKNRKNNKSA